MSNNYFEEMFIEETFQEEVMGKNTSRNFLLDYLIMIKQMKKDPAVQGSYLYLQASSLFKNAQQKKDIDNADKALNLAKKALVLENKNKKNVIEKANQTHDQYSKLVKDINNYIATNKTKNIKKK